MQVTIEYPPDGGAFLTATGGNKELRAVAAAILVLDFHVTMRPHGEQLILSTEKCYVTELVRVLQTANREQE